MPGEVGKFLALTGTPFNGSEAQGYLGLADHIFEFDDYTEIKLSELLMMTDQAGDAMDIYGSSSRPDVVDFYKHFKDATNKMEEERLKLKHSEEAQDLTRSTSFEPEMTKERAEDEIDMKFKHFLRENLYAKALKPQYKIGSGNVGKYVNHYLHRATLFEEFIETQDGNITDSLVRKYEADINR